jgi:hypothetical protein
MTYKVLYLAIFNLAFILPWSEASASSFLGIMEWNDNPATLVRVGDNWPGGGGASKDGFNSIAWRIYQNPGNDIPTVTSQPAGFDYYYEYTIVVDTFTPQNLLLQIADVGTDLSGFTNFNVSKSAALTGAGTATPVQTNAAIGHYTSAEFTQLPESTFGLVFTAMGGNVRQNVADTTTISFWSKYGPVAANFFTNCGGGGNRAWNTGFEDPENENSGFIMAPVPEPSAYALAMGFAALVLIVSPRTRKSGS